MSTTSAAIAAGMASMAPSVHPFIVMMNRNAPNQPAGMKGMNDAHTLYQMTSTMKARCLPIFPASQVQKNRPSVDAR